MARWWTGGVALMVLGVCISLMLGLPSSAAAFCRMSASNPSGCCNPSDSGCTFVRWERRCIGIGIEEDGSRDLPRPSVAAIVDRAFGAWVDLPCGSTPSGFQVQRFAEASQCDRPEFNTDAGNINSIGFVDNWSGRGNDPGAFAITTVWNDTNTGQIFDVDIEVNQERWTFAECPAAGCDTGSIDLEAILTREAGHFFGLGESDVIGATMTPNVIRGDTSARTLEFDDFEGFCSIYPTGAPGGDCDFEPEGGFSTECGGSLGCSCTPTESDSAPADASLIFAAIWYLRRRSRRRRFHA